MKQKHTPSFLFALDEQSDFNPAYSRCPHPPCPTRQDPESQFSRLLQSERRQSAPQGAVEDGGTARHDHGHPGPDGFVGVLGDHDDEMAAAASAYTKVGDDSADAAAGGAGVNGAAPGPPQ